MKSTIAAALLACSLAAVGLAQAQNAYPVPSAPPAGNPYPNLPLQSETSPYPGIRERSYYAPPAAPAVRDTPESLNLYNQCQKRVNREATGNDSLRIGIAGCLDELNQRRQAGQ
jgi:hypothetical protein